MQEQISLEGYKSYTNERMGEAKQGVGLAELVNEDLVSNEWSGDPETEEEVRRVLSSYHPTLVSNPRNCRLPVYVSFLFAPPRMSNSSLFVLPLIGAPSSFVLIRPYSSLFVLIRA